MPILRYIFLIGLIVFGASSCGKLIDKTYLMRTAGSANDHILLVRESPPTFGFTRLQTISRRSPDLGLFVKKEGMPRYLVETRKSGSRYLILYYPASRHAFACRDSKRTSNRLEFSGPYPITNSELTTLQSLEPKVD